jgi:purine-nucleoside phosphorylase
VNSKNVSETSWQFEQRDSASRLVDEVRSQTGLTDFDLAVVLGSGWKEAVGFGETLGIFDYRDWPCFPGGQIQGHDGQLIAVRFSSCNILIFSGRFHCYQGLDALQAALPVRFAAALGCQRILLTCAAGGIHKNFKPGDFMLVEDHINLLGDNPLRGLDGNTFIDLADLYDKNLYDRLASCRIDGLVLHRGVLVAMTGPSYETPAEIGFLRTAGADVVSMSTVPEAIMAKFLGMRVAAVAFVANHAAGITADELCHEDVLLCSSQHARFFPLLIKLIIDTWQAITPRKHD